MKTVELLQTRKRGYQKSPVSGWSSIRVTYLAPFLGFTKQTQTIAKLCYLHVCRYGHVHFCTHMSMCVVMLTPSHLLQRQMAVSRS